MTNTAHYPAPMIRDAIAELTPLLDALAAAATRGEVPGPELLARVAQARPQLVRAGSTPQGRRAVLALDTAGRRRG